MLFKGHKDYELKLDHKVLVATLRYDPEDGAFYRIAPGPGVTVGRRADYIEKNGYRYVHLRQYRYGAGRLAWFYVHGSWPAGVIRPINGAPADIRLSNLRDAEWTWEKKLAADREKRKTDRDRFRGYDLKKTFGITLDQYNAKLSAQDGVCAICGNPEQDIDGRGFVRALAVDHNHKTGELRDLLCGACNRMIGNGRESIEILEKAIAYLKRHDPAVELPDNVVSIRPKGASE